MKNFQNSPFELLKDKTILAILDGDTEFGEFDGVKISILYLSGPEIVKISQFFGLSATYEWNGVRLSRWAYLDNLLKHGIETNQINEVLLYLFSKKQFAKKLSGITTDRVDEIYTHIVQTIIDKINGILYLVR